MQAEALARRGHRVTVVSPDRSPAGSRSSQARFERSSFARVARSSPRPTCGSRRSGRRCPPALAGARGPVFHLCQGYEGHSSSTATLWPRDRGRLPRCRRASSRSRSRSRAARGARLRPGRRRRPGVRPDGVLARAAARRRGRAARRPRRRSVRGRRQGNRRRARRVSRSGASAAAGSASGASRTRRRRTEERRRGLTDEYHHGLAPERMPFAYRVADVFIGPSRSVEGFGLPALEALACGVPCLLSDTPGHREIAGDAALATSPTGTRGLAAALPALLSARRARGRGWRGPAPAARFDTSAVAARLERARSAEAFGGTARMSAPPSPVVVVNHRSAAEAAACVASLAGGVRAGGDRRRDRARGLRLRARTRSARSRRSRADAEVFLPENRGYSGGVNAGLARARARAASSSPTRTSSFSPGALSALLGRARGPGAWAPPRRCCLWDAGGRLRLPGFDSASQELLSGELGRRRRPASPPFARQTLRLWERGGDARHLSAPCSPPGARCSTASAASTSDSPSSTRRRSGRTASARPGSGCGSCRRRASATSGRASAAARSRDRPAAGGLAPPLPASGATAASAAPARARGARVRRAPVAASRSPSPRCRRAPGATGSPLSPNPSLIPFAGASLATDFRLPDEVARVAASRTCVPATVFRTATAGRSRRSSGRRRRERLRDPRRDRRRRARGSARSSRASSAASCPRRSGTGSSRDDPDGWFGIVAVPTARSSATTPAGGCGSGSAGRRACSTPSATSRPTRPCARSAAAAASTARWPTRSTTRSAARRAVLLRVSQRPGARDQQPARRLADALSDPREARAPRGVSAAAAGRRGGRFVGEALRSRSGRPRARLPDDAAVRDRVARQLALPRAARRATTGWSGGGRASELAGWAALSVVGERGAGRGLPAREPDGRGPAAALRRRRRGGAAGSGRGASSSGRRRAVPGASRSRRCRATRRGGLSDRSCAPLDEAAVERFARALHSCRRSTTSDVSRRSAANG